MKINLDTPITTDPQNNKSIRLGLIFEDAIFKSQGLQNAKELYDKIKGKEEVDLSIKELSAIQCAVEARFISGIVWQIDGIINGTEEEVEQLKQEHKAKKNEK